MKKKSLTDFPWWGSIKTLWRIMKLTTLISLCFVISVTANSYSQSTKLNLKLSNSTVKEILNQIETESEYVFLYNLSELDENRRVNVNLENATITQVLDEILKGQNLKYTLYDRQVIIRADEQVRSVNRTVQPQTASGKVTTASGEPIPGVTVVVKGVNTGTITDLDGSFTLNNVRPGSVLVFSFVGMVSQEVSFDGQTYLNVKLVEETIGIEEVVAIGYGTIRKRDLTGSVASVKSDDITRIPTFNAMEALQGQVTGVDVIRQSGKAGSDVEIRIRGNRSINGSNSPLIIIDGMQGGSYTDIAPEDIESIEVLKDASSTAIYGSQGANGVIIITTKKGKAGETKISYSGYYGVNGWAQYPEMLTGEDFLNVRREAYRANGSWNSPADDVAIFSSTEWEAIQNGYYTNWVDEVMHNGIQQSHQITATMGNEKATSYLSAGYYNEKGSFADDEMKRYSIRMNADYKMYDFLTLGGTAQVTHYATDIRASNVLWRAATNSPLGRAYDDEGNVILFPLGTSFRVSPLADEADDYIASYNRLNTNVIANGYLEFRPVSGLSFRSNIGTNLKFARNGDYAGANSIDRAGQYSTSTSSITASTQRYYSWDNILNFSKNIGEHSFGVTALTSWTKSMYDNVYAYGEGQLVANQLFYSLGANNKDTYNIASGYVGSQTLSFAGRINYSYRDKYLLTVSSRWDGASRLSEQWAMFPSVAGAWRISEEGFMADTKNWLSNAKLRVSWGTTGNSGISEYGTQSGVSPFTNAAFQEQGFIYYNFNTIIGNKDLGWEISKSIDYGLDLGILDNRVSVVFDYYDTKTDDILMLRSLPTSMGSGNNTPFQTYQNIGSSRNKGIELAINTVNIDKKDFKWSTNFTYSRNKEKITSLIDGENIYDGQRKEHNSLILGAPIKSYYTFDRQGIWMASEAAEAATYFKDAGKTQPFQPGDIKLRDINGDNVIDGVNDVTYIGSRTPKWVAGLNNSFYYKGIDFSFYLTARWGQLLESDFTGAFDPKGDTNFPAYFKYWTPEATKADFPRPNNGEFFNYVGYQSYWFADGSYVKLKNVTLGYTLPNSWLKSANISNLRVYVTGANLLTFNNNPLIKDYDPERGGAARDPLTRQFVFGVNVNF
ncbi:TonB-dependent receptor [Gaoshiqia sp. Z1-71]|uniref:TonB-dependent receptor n=1 Tax=Gaoshiqia hydrogeniformans TaxID=3290090 RepID=UPI003BF86B36